MGKTTTTLREEIENLRIEMTNFRRAMKPRYQEHYDHLFDNIRHHAMPAKMSNQPDIKWLLVFTACIGQQRQIDELREDFEELETRKQGSE